MERSGYLYDDDDNAAHNHSAVNHNATKTRRFQLGTSSEGFIGEELNVATVVVAIVAR